LNASLKVRKARRQLQRELFEWRDAGAPASAVSDAIDDLIHAHIAPLIEAKMRGELREARRKDPKRAAL
jgi:hypothetical protein